MQLIPSPAAQRAACLLRKAGFETVFVGGCVRDACRGVTPHDFDLATAAYPAEMLSVFSGCRVLTTGIRHGTVTVVFDREAVEITSFRADGAYSDGRRPDAVRFSRSLDEDLARRDFTVNALAVGANGRLIDRFGGLNDLKNGVLRAIGDADARFREDALRILRALRFSARLGFVIEPDTAAALFRNKELLTALSGERVASELFSLLEAPGAGVVVGRYFEVLQTVLPELTNQDAVKTLDLLPAEAPLRLAALLLPAGEETARRALSRLCVSNRICRRVLAAVRLGRRPFPPAEEDLLRLLACGGEQAALDCAALREASGEKNCRARLAAVLAKRPCVSLSALAVDGNDLLEGGIAAGKPLGAALRALLDAVIAGRVENERNALLAFLRENPPKK